MRKLGCGRYFNVVDIGNGIVKKIPKENESIHHMIKEMVILKYLNHNNIASIKKVGFVENTYIVYMNKYFNITKKINCVDFIKDISDVLVYIHSNNITHRDIKPDNIMVDSMNNIKLIDWGLSGLKSSLSRSKYYFTFRYRPIEMLKGYDGNSKKGDIWSLAITVLEIYHNFKMTTKNERQTLQAILDKFGNDSPTPQKIMQLFKGMKINIATCISGMLNYNSYNRWSAEQIIMYLEKPITPSMIQLPRWNVSLNVFAHSSKSYIYLYDITIAVCIHLDFNSKVLMSTVIISKEYMDKIYDYKDEKIDIPLIKEHEIREIIVASMFLSICLYENCDYEISDLQESLFIYDKYKIKLNTNTLMNQVFKILNVLKCDILHDMVFNTDAKSINNMSINFCYMLLLLIDNYMGDIEGAVVYLRLYTIGESNYLKVKMEKTVDQMEYFKLICKNRNGLRDLIYEEVPQEDIIVKSS